MTNWYPAQKVKGGPEGFTSDPNYAQTARVGDQDLPILCRGGVMALVQKTNTASLKIWERLLDAMEQRYEMIEEREALLKQDPPTSEALHQSDLDLHKNNALQAGLICALAMLMYGCDDDNAIKLIQAQANVRYSAES